MKPTSEELPKASAGETFVVDTGWKAVLPPWVAEREGLNEGVMVDCKNLIACREQRRGAY